jgi:hypothetical protein
MRVFCNVVLLVVGLACEVFAELKIFSIPGDFSWGEAQQGPISEQRFLDAIDLTRSKNGISPIDPFLLVAVPDITIGVDATSTQDSLLREFSQNVTRHDVAALQDAQVGERRVLKGEILIHKWSSFPRDVDTIALLRLSGVDSVEAMVNVAESFPRPPGGDKFNKGLNLTTLGIFERALTKQRLQEGLAWVFDGDPDTHFERIDRVGQDVKQTWTLYVDLGRFFPIRLVRLFPSSESPVRVSAYTFFRGIAGTEKAVPGLSLDDPDVGQLAFPEFTKIAPSFPTFVTEQSVPVNVLDTIRVDFDPPSKLRYSRIDFRTQLDYDLAEMEFYADGFVPQAYYESRPLPLPAATLGRIFWDEEKIGDPTNSNVTVRVQTGLNAEPQVMFRVNEFESKVEWKDEGAIVVDRRPGSRTLGQEVDLNDPQYNLEAREVFSALLPEERESVRLTREEYQSLPGNLRRQVEPDLEFWSGVQKVNSGELIKAPSGRPFIQIQIEFESLSPDAATVLNNLRFEYSAPQITDLVVGEIAPSVGVIAGRDTVFNMAIKASLGPENNGINCLQVFTPARVNAVESLAIQDIELTLAATADEEEIDGAEFKILHVDDDQFVVGFSDIKPEDVGSDGDVILDLRFRARVIDFQTNFSANVFLDTLQASYKRLFTKNGILTLGADSDTLALFLPQPVEGANVVDFTLRDALSDRNSLAVVADISSQGSDLISNVQFSGESFTPNGDGVNDELLVGYDVQRLLEDRALHFEIYDLGGNRVRHLEKELRSGGYSDSWDGKNDAGIMVVPGIYVVRLSADADEASAAVSRLVSVVY